MNNFEKITLEKGLYNITGKNFTQALEALDPDADYAGTELEGLDAFERQLKRFDIRVSGENSDRVEKFFKTTESAVLFPEFVRRSIKQGMDEASILPEVIAAATNTDGTDYRGILITKSGADTAISEGGEFPVTTVNGAASLTTLSKFGRKISSSYEVIRKQRLDLFAVVLKSVGAQISRAVNKQAMDVLKNGAASSTISGTELAYSDLAAFWATLADYNMTTMVVSPATMAKILSFDEMKYCIGDYMTGGTVKTPYGVTLVKCTGVDDGIAIGLDKSCALEMVIGSDIVVDSSKLISTQIDEIVFSVTVGFDKVSADAVKILNTVKA